MKHYIYILECTDKNNKITLYCGYTSRTPAERLKDHQRNINKNNKKHYTGRQKSIKLVYSETFDNRQTAIKREREIKKKGSLYKKKLVESISSQ